MGTKHDGADNTENEKGVRKDTPKLKWLTHGGKLWYSIFDKPLKQLEVIHA